MRAEIETIPKNMNDREEVMKAQINSHFSWIDTNQEMMIAKMDRKVRGCSEAAWSP
jgi:hypothetical protein